MGRRRINCSGGNLWGIGIELIINLFLYPSYFLIFGLSIHSFEQHPLNFLAPFSDKEKCLLHIALAQLTILSVFSPVTKHLLITVGFILLISFTILLSNT